MPRSLTASQIEAFKSDGVVLVRDAITRDWVTRLNQFAEGLTQSRFRWMTDTGPSSEPEVGRALDVRYLWHESALVRDFVFGSGIAPLVAQAMGSATLRFYFDHWFLKEPGRGTVTPWHQDAPYWPFSGAQIASFWLALTDITEEAAPLEFVLGSHLWGKRYKPKRFVPEDRADAWIESADGEELPDIDAHRGNYELYRPSMSAGDALVFSAWLVHAAPDNISDSRRVAVSTRWLGDDVRWAPHPAADPTVLTDAVEMTEGDAISDEERFPRVVPGTAEH